MIGTGIRAIAVNPPEASVVTVVGVVPRVAESILIVTFVNGARLAPDIEIAVPAGPVDVNKEAIGLVVIVNVAIGLFVPSDASTVLLPPAVAGTLNVTPLKLPAADAVTVAGVVASGDPLNVNVTACDGTKLEPETVTV